MEQEILKDGIKKRLRAATGGTERRRLAERNEPHSGDASAPVRRTTAITRRSRESIEFGSPVHGEFDDDESPEEARERWLHQEHELPDGVHGLGGQTAGGIFGDGPIATEVYDPGSMARGASVRNMQSQARAAEALEGAANMVMQLAQRFGITPELPAAPRGRLPRRR